MNNNCLINYTINLNQLLTCPELIINLPRINY